MSDNLRAGEVMEGGGLGWIKINIKQKLMFFRLNHSRVVFNVETS